MPVSSVLGEIVERVPKSPETENSFSSFSSFALRPVRAVAGTAFPSVRPDRTYPLHSPPPPISSSSPSTNTFPFPSSSSPFSSSSVFREHNTAAESLVEQWDPRDLDKLRCGYFQTPPAPHLSDESFCGESYIKLWLRFMRSAVRRHRALAVEALRTKCACDAALRNRFVYGDDSAQLMHFLISGGIASAHDETSRHAAECLSDILYSAAAEAKEAIGEIAVPPTDAADEKDIVRDTCVQKDSDAVEENADGEAGETTYAEISAWLRTDEDRARALERLSFSAAVLNAAPILSPPLVARLLLGGNVCTLPSVARRMAADPRYISRVKERVGEVVIGKITLSEMAEEWLLLRRVLHVREAAHALAAPLREIFVLLIHHVSSTTDTANTVRETVALLAVFLALRAMVRHGFSGIFTDASDALLARGAISRGAAISAEMWLLAKAEDATLSEMSTMSDEFAREALHQVMHVPPPSSFVREGETSDALLREKGKCAEEKRETGAAAEESWNALLAGVGAMHYLATYFTVVDGSARLGLTSDARKDLRRRLLTADCLRCAFVRCDISAADLRDLSAVAREAFGASLTYGRVRLAAALDDCDSNDETTIVFAASMASRFESKCMGLARVAGHLLPDELCTMIEIVDIMRRGGSRWSRESFVAEIFVLQSIFLTKHGLDASPALIVSALGDSAGAPINRESPAPLSAIAESFCRALVQSQWPWIVYPLHDMAQTNITAWAAWVRRALGADQRIKHVLSWDTLLAHTLAWAVAHRETAAHVFALLEELCAGLLPTAGAPFSPAACATMRQLATSAPPHDESPLHKTIAETIALAATVCEPSVAAALVRLLAAANVEITDEKKAEKETREELCGAVLECWANTGRIGEADGTAVSWDVESFAELLQAATGDEWARGDAVGLRLARQVAEGIAKLYVRQRGSLSAFEIEVVRGSVDVARWCPSAIDEFI